MAATAAQIAEIRLLSGDTASSSDYYVVSDSQISTWYDETSSICGTAYKVAWARLADASKDLGTSGDGTTRNNPKVQQIQELLGFLKANCTEARQATTTLSINLGIDEETDLVDIE